MSPTTSSVSPDRSSPLRCTASTTRSPLSVTIPGNTVSPISAERGGTTTSARPDPRLTSASGSWSSAYWSTRVRARLPKSRVTVRAFRSGNRRSPKRTTIAIVPARSGSPTSANSKNPNRPTPASSAYSETITFTGDPVRASSEPAWAPNASGSSSWEGDMRRRTAITATTGRRAATEPFTLISAVSTATSSIMRTSTRRRLPPDRAISSWPAHAVTPVESSPSLTTNSDAMKITAGSPKPPSDCSSSSTPVAQSESATPTATTATGSRSQTKTATVAARIRKVIVDWLIRSRPTVAAPYYSIAAAMPSMTRLATARSPISGSMKRIHLS